MHKMNDSSHVWTTAENIVVLLKLYYFNFQRRFWRLCRLQGARSLGRKAMKGNPMSSHAETVLQIFRQNVNLELREGELALLKLGK